jgi:hypothetical protein
LGREAKSDLVGMYGAKRPCLPDILRKNGYNTVFMQSAPLGYMRKDLLAEKAGFNEIIGGWQFENYITMGRWGVDDATLYNYAVSKVKDLNKSDDPWFLTLLTVTTHHPFVVPGKTVPSKEEAVKYADDSLGMFMRALHREGLLQDTLLIVTSDEATFSYAPEGIQRQLSTIHAPLVIVAPHLDSAMTHEELFTQADLQLSILDYLSLNSDSAMGRSVFRRYPTGRNLISGSVYDSNIYGLSDDRKLYVCKGFLDCIAYDYGDRGPFYSPLRQSDASDEYVLSLRQALAYNELNTDKLRTSIVFREKDKKYRGDQLLLGANKIAANKGDTLTWKVNIVPDGVVHVVIALNTGLDKKHLLYKKEKISPDNPLNFHYEYNVPDRVEKILTKVSVIAPPGVGYTVKDLTIERRKGSN